MNGRRFAVAALAMMTATACVPKAPIASGSAITARIDGRSGAPPPVPAGLPALRVALAKSTVLTLVVGDVGGAVTAAQRVVARAGGAVTGLADEVPDQRDRARTATVDVVVPAGRLDGTVTQLTTLGALRARSSEAVDLGDAIVDTAARLRNLRREERDLARIMDRAQRTSEVLDVATKLADVRGEIERLDALAVAHERRVATATIHLVLTDDRRAAPAGEPTIAARLADAWDDARRTALAAALGLASGLFYAVAFLPFALGVSVLALLARRRLRRAPAGPDGGRA